MTLPGVKRKIVSVSDFRFTGRLLGKGNFARVEEAVHNVLNVKVAVKIIDIKEVKEKYVVRNLHREARMMSALNHPCIAALFQTMQLADNVYYLVSELVSGGDLCSFIIGQRYGKLEERAAKVYARQFASALAHMHSFGIVHRDLKMENVILNAAKTQIKIVDFGLSNVWTSDNPLRTHCGSPEYAAPELFVAGKEYGPEVDLWSLGIIFYGMVVGQLPFVGGRKNQLSSQERRKRLVAEISKGLGPSQKQAIAPLSPEFRSMLSRLLTADPDRRITTKELIVHPWITEKGRKFVQTHPFRKLTSECQAKFIKQVHEHYKVDQNTVMTEISKNPYGRYGGMYNILSYKCTTEQFNLENIAPNVAHDKAEPPPVKTVRPKSAAPATKSHHTLYNQCVVLLNKVSKQQIEQQQQQQQRSKTANPALLAKNVARVSRSKVDHRPTRAVSAKPVSTAKTIRTKVQEVGTPPSVVGKRSSSRRRGAESDKNQRDFVKRPHTTGATRAATKTQTQKRSSLLTATARSQKPNIPEFRQISGNPAGMGDASGSKRGHPKAVPVQKTRVKDPLANEPIARSIAGFLFKNVPERMLNDWDRRSPQQASKGAF